MSSQSDVVEVVEPLELVLYILSSVEPVFQVIPDEVIVAAAFVQHIR